MMKISVVIPVFNVEKYIGECLESVINQTRKPDEVIIVDDSSTDDSAEICKSYIEKADYIKLVTNSERGGKQSQEQRNRSGKRRIYALCRWRRCFI